MIGINWSTVIEVFSGQRFTKRETGFGDEGLLY